MRKLKLQVQITVDGYVARPDGGLDWMTFTPDETMFSAINALTDSSDTILLGRKMTQGFVNYWEDVVDNQPESPEHYFAVKMVETPKVIFTKTLTAPVGRNTSLAKGDLVSEVTALKNKPGKDIIVYGGAGFVSSLLQEGLIDELNLFVNPVLIGKGMRIFDTLDSTRKLRLEKATPFGNGETLLTYALL